MVTIASVERLARIWPALILLPLGAVATAQEDLLRTSPSELLANVGSFDGKLVEISSAILNLQEGGPGAGKRAYTFDLSDGTQAVHVRSAGLAPCKTRRATVEGRFEKGRQQITATRVRCR